VFNTKILGSITRSKQWRCPLNQKGDAVAKVSFSNKKMRLAMDNIAHLVDFVVSSPDDAELKGIWMKMLDDYRETMKILQKCSEYTEEDINNFQSKIDYFFTAYVEKSGAGKERVTNYIHMLSSSHITYYMKTHDNLYKYSQQVWESLNKTFKLSLFNHTQRGGNYGKEVMENERTYFCSIFMFFQRELLWISGLAEKHFVNK
jgi:hypothetical protein